jgi:hypothetical protein
MRLSCFQLFFTSFRKQLPDSKGNSSINFTTESNCNRSFVCCFSNVIFQRVLQDSSLNEFHFETIHEKNLTKLTQTAFGSEVSTDRLPKE